MDDFKKYSVVQANKFIRETSWNLKLDTIKIFKLLISRIDTKNPPKDNTIILSKKEIMNILTDYNKQSNENYTYAKARIKELICAVKVVDDEDHEIYTSLVQKVDWYKNNDVITVRFSDEVMPYLIVVNQFLQYDIDNVRGFRSKYGVILYENLYSYYKQYNKNVFIIDVARLKFLTDTTNVLTNRFDRWETRVLKAGIEDLNRAGVEILAKYEKIKEWKKVVSIKFFVRERTSYKETKYEEVYQTSLFDDVEETEDEERLLPWEL